MKKTKIIVGIIGGRAKIGKIFRKFFIKNVCKVLVSGRKTRLTKEELAKKSDIVIFSVPISETSRIIREVLPFTRENQLLVDLTSVKNGILKEMLRSKAEVISLHPMFFSINSLEGQTILFMPLRTKKLGKWLCNIFNKNKVKLVKVDYKNHDNMMALLQVLVNFSFASTAYSLKNLAKKHRISFKKLLEIGGNVYRIRLGMMSRILSQPEIYADIAMLNPQSKEVLREYLKNAKDFAGLIDKKNKAKYIKHLNEAHDFFGDFNKEALEQTNFMIQKLGKIKKKR